MFRLRGKLSENLIPFVLASFVFMSLFGMGIGMEMKDGQMSSCPFTASQASICQMSVTEHISQWQHSFLGIPTKINLLILSLLLLSIIIVPFAKSFTKVKQIELAAQLIFYYKTAVTKILNQLLIAFSDGILNPKIYELARS